MTLLAFVRHGQTDWNLALRIQGRTDIPLNDTGRAQALLAAERLRDGGYDRIVASPLQRARETAAIIASDLGLDEPRTHLGLAERDYGEGEGMLVADFRARYGHGPVPGAETHEQLTRRALAALTDVAADGGPGEDERLIVVAHGGLIRAVVGHASGGTQPRPGERIENGSVTLLRLSGGELAFLDGDFPEEVPAAGRRHAEAGA